MEPDKCRSGLKGGRLPSPWRRAKAVIDRTQCVGRTVCAQGLPFGTIVKEEV